MEHKVCSTDHLVKGALLEQVSCVHGQLPRQRLQDDGVVCCSICCTIDITECHKAAAAGVKLPQRLL